MEDFVITRFNSLFKAYDPKGRKTHFKNRRFACFIITLKGKIRFSYDGGEVIASAGHPVFLPKDLSYVNECLETAESLVFNFYTLHSYQHPLQLAPVSDAFAGEIYERICVRGFSPSLENALAILADLYALSCKLMEGCGKESASHPIIAKATEYMRQYCHRTALTVGEVARHCYISEVYLRKLFEREAHTTPFRKLTELRMQKAKLLIEEKRPLKEVAVSVGYSDVFQFSRAYKRYFGYPPSKK